MDYWNWLVLLYEDWAIIGEEKGPEAWKFVVDWAFLRQCFPSVVYRYQRL